MRPSSGVRTGANCCRSGVARQSVFPLRRWSTTLDALLQEPLPAPREVNPSLSDLTSDLVVAMMAPDADQRPRDYGDLLRKMQSAFIRLQGMRMRELTKRNLADILNRAAVPAD